MYVSVNAVARGRARRWRKYTVALEIANLLNGAPSTPRDIDGAQIHRLETCHPSSPWSSPESLHKHFGATLEHMTEEEIITFVAGLDGVLTLRPAPGDGSPEI